MKRDSRQRDRAPAKAGADNVPALLAALASESSDDRKAAAAALASVVDQAGVGAALTNALSDTAPKVRKSAAMALARKGNAGAVAVIARALAAEEFDWVRASMILSLGKIGGAEAAAALEQHEAQSQQERDAMAKARDHVGANEVEVRWRAGEPLDLDLVYGCAPAGLESVAVDEAKSCGLAVRKASPGLLHFPRIHPAGLLARLRCLYDIRLLVATGESLNVVPPGEVPRRLADLLANSDVLRQWRASIETSDETLRYRFALEGLQLPKSTFRETLAAVRAALQAHGLADSPSRYAALLRIEVTSAATKVWFVPTFEADVRFDYRKADVGASISPVIGACLVRLMRIGAEGTIVDPTCGSGTLLIERALLDDGVKLVGIDVSPTAVRAAGENVAAARLQPRITITLGDATDPAKWPQRCSEVIANLPFGARSAAMDRDLKTVYRQIVSTIAARLDSGGRALLYTANARLLEPEIESHRDRLQLIETRVITAGGMSVRVWLLRGR